MENLTIVKDKQYYKFCMYGFFKNLRFFEPFFILFFIDKGLTFFQIGTIYATKEIAINILEIPTGVIADALGRKKSMITAFVAYIVAFVIFYFFNTYLLFLLAILFFSVGDALRTGTHKAMIFEYLKINNWLNQKVKYYGNTRSWSQFGSAISAIIAAIVVVISGNYQLVFLVATIPYIADLLLMISYPNELNGDIQKNDKLNIKNSFVEVFNQFKISFKYKAIWVCILNLSLYQGFFRSSKDYLQPIVVLAVSGLPLLHIENEESRVAVFIGIIYFVIYILSSLTSRNAARLTNKFSSLEKITNISLLAGILIGILSGILVYYDFPIIAIILFALIFVIQNIRKPVGTALVVEQVKSDILATALSIQSQFDSLLSAVFALLIGFIADAFNVGAALSVLCILLLIVFPFFRIRQVRS
ncbi:MAG: MFS transporter [Salinivirgaceae bacterium]|nr:MFS transporter [Salinivirgaceae bacterium]